MHINHTSNPSNVTVVGGTGKTGRRVVRRLAALGHRVRPVSRATGFDWDDPATWPTAVTGADAVYLSFAPDIALPGAAEQVGALARLAASAGARRLVLLSGRGEEGAERAEHLVQEVGVGWTVVRSSWFDQNFDEGHLLPAVLEGELVLPAGAVREPFVDADDLADVAVAALVSDAHRERVYEVTGPQSLSFSEVADELSAATGRSISYVPVSPDDYVDVLTASWADPEEAAALAELFVTVLDGRNEPVGDGVQRALGRAPRSFADYVRRVAATGVWTTKVVAMSGVWTWSLTAASAVGAGTVGGVFFAFSTFVMAGLDRLPSGTSIEAMQAINAAAPSAWFMSALFGTALLAGGLAVWSAFHLDEPAALLRLIGGCVYLVSILLTIAYHVPRNEALDQVDPRSAGAGARWSSYVTGWTTLNHVRTLSAIAACALFVAAVWAD